MPLEGVEAIHEHAQQRIVLRERYSIQVKCIWHNNVAWVGPNDCVLMASLNPFGIQGARGGMRVCTNFVDKLFVGHIDDHVVATPTQIIFTMLWHRYLVHV